MFIWWSYNVVLIMIFLRFEYVLTALAKVVQDPLYDAKNIRVMYDVGCKITAALKVGLYIFYTTLF